MDLGHPIEGSGFFDEFDLYSVGKRLYKGNDGNRQLYSRTSPIFIVNSCKWILPTNKSHLFSIPRTALSLARFSSFVYFLSLPPPEISSQFPV